MKMIERTTMIATFAKNYLLTKNMYGFVQIAGLDGVMNIKKPISSESAFWP